jgi:basic amino acid/polyamine antiporter, APA family
MIVGATRAARGHSATNKIANPDALLARELGVRSLAANVFNYTVGSGIFALPAFAVLELGSAAPLAYLACTVVMALVVLCFAEAGSRVGASGGAYAYVETAFGPMFGFVAGCLVLSTGMSAAAAVSTLFARSLLALVPGAPDALVSVVIVALFAMLVAINVRGVRTGARTIEVVTVAKLLPLVAFVVIGVFFVDIENVRWNAMPDVGAVLGTAGVVIFAFAGIEGATLPSGEVKDPARTVPRAVFLALGAATLLYLAIQFVALGILGLELASDRTTPLATAAQAVVGPIGRTVMIVGAVVSMFGYLSANVLSAPRAVFAMSRDRFLPWPLAAVHAAHRTPHVAIVVYGAVVAAIALSGTFEQLAVFSNLAALLLYFLCAAGVLALRRRDIRAGGPPFEMPGGRWVPIATCAAVAWLFYETVDRDQLIALAVVLVLVIALYGVRTWREQSTA